MIYYVEDDRNIRDLVIYTLERSGYRAQGFESGAAFFDAMQVVKPDMVLLDIMLPMEDGIDILEKVKANPDTAALPIIMITALNSENDKVIGLDTGADDYITKPFGVMELVSRVKALLRRSSEEEKELLIGGITLYPEAYIAECNGVRIDFTLKEFELLAFLIRNPNVAFTRELLLDNVWGYEYEGSSHTVDVHIQTLRKKLGSFGNMIETVRGVGYRFGELLDD